MAPKTNDTNLTQQSSSSSTDYTSSTSTETTQSSNDTNNRHVYIQPKTNPHYWLVSICTCIVGISTWIAVSAIWVELPILTSALPEGSRLPSYIVVISQMANIGPFLYTALVFRAGGGCRRWFPSHLIESTTIILILSIGLLACILLSFLWHRIFIVGGTPFSGGLLILLFALSTVDCTSSVTHVPYMSDHWPQFLVTFFLGEGLCGLFASLLALIQGIEKTTSTTVGDGTKKNEYHGQRFSISTYFLLIALLLLLSLVSFLVLLFLHRRLSARTRRQTHSASINIALDDDEEGVSSASGSVRIKSKAVVYMPYNESNPAPPPQIEADDSLPATYNSQWPMSPPSSPRSPIHKKRLSADIFPSRRRSPRSGTPNGSSQQQNGDDSFSWLSFLPYGAAMSWLAFMAIGVISIQSFSALPYGRQVYLWASIAGQIGSPVGRLLTIVVKLPRLIFVLILNAVTTAISVYICIAAHFDAGPSPMLGQTFGAIVVIALWFAFNVTTSIARVSIVNLLKSRGRKSLVTVGFAYQCGALVGSVVFFLVINFSTVFH